MAAERKEALLQVVAAAVWVRFEASGLSLLYLRHPRHPPTQTEEKKKCLRCEWRDRSERRRLRDCDDKCCSKG